MKTVRRVIVPAVCYACFCFLGPPVCLGAGKPDLNALQNALTFHADFDRSFDAVLAKGDAKLYTASSSARKNAKPGNRRADVSIIKDGRFGSALRFSDKAKQVIFFRAEGNMQYRKKNFSGNSTESKRIAAPRARSIPRRKVMAFSTS